MTDEARSELQHLLSALCDGELDDHQHARLETLLAGDDACRRLYLEYVDMHARLLVDPRLEQSGTPAPGTRARAWAGDPGKRVNRRRLRQFTGYGLVAAATLAVSFLFQFFWWRTPAPAVARPTRPSSPASQPVLPEYIATLTQANDCVWLTPGEAWRVGARLLPGEFRLQKGIARIRFDSGPDLVVDGPAEVHLDSATSATVLRGKVLFKGDETATAFDLHTPASTLLDFGTEYAVAVGAEGEEVHVFDGAIRRTPRADAAQVEPEQIAAGQARRYERPGSPGRVVPLDRDRFVRQRTVPEAAPADPAAGLLAYEGFDYPDPKMLQASLANGGIGWLSPWIPGFARPLTEGDRNHQALNVKESLVRAGFAAASAGGSFDYTGFAKYWRRLATPVRLDTDGVYYLSFLFRRQGPPADPLNAVAVLLRTTEELQRDREDPAKRLNIGIGGANQLFTHLQRVGSRTPLPLNYGETYLLVAKIVASKSNPDQVFMRVYGPGEPTEREEQGNWSVVGPPFQSDLVFDWLEVHINSKTRQTIDEIRLGTTWSSVTAPWTKPMR